MTVQVSGTQRWRETRLPEVERAALREIKRFERKFGPIKTPWIPVDRFIEDLWEYRYVHADPTAFGFPADAQGGLRLDLKKMVVADWITNRGQENATKMHEGGHVVLHVPRMTASSNSLFCRRALCYLGNQQEPPWMYREAEYFAACMLLPRDRLTPRAAGRIGQAWREESMLRGSLFPGPQWFRMTHTRTVVPILDRALRRLHEDYECEVSKSLMRIRLEELGFAPPETQALRISRTTGLTRLGYALATALEPLFAAEEDRAQPGTTTRSGAA